VFSQESKAIMTAFHEEQTEEEEEEEVQEEEDRVIRVVNLTLQKYLVILTHSLTHSYDS
jgi:chorismate-pyruvate lyase